MSDKPHQTPSGSPEIDMLNEIMDRTMPRIPDPPEQASPDSKDSGGQEDVSRETPETDQPSTTAKNKRSSVYIYLAVLFGAAFLMLLLAYFVQQRNSDAVRDDLRTTTASREELLEDIKALEAEKEKLQSELAYQQDQTEQLKEERDRYEQTLDDTSMRLNNQSILSISLEYFWYVDQLMSSRDYPMAAAAVVFSADFWRDTWESQVPVNPVQVEQYEAHRQELINKGYLQQLDHPRDDGSDIWFTDRWNPSENEDMAALSILWMALDQHFVVHNDEAASQYLCLYPLGDPATGYPDRVERLASDFTLEQCQIMKDELSADQWITIAEDGTIVEGYGPTGFRTDVLYTLPFELPAETLAKIPLIPINEVMPDQWVE